MQQTTESNGGGNPMIDAAVAVLPLEEDQLREIETRAREADRKARSFIRENPTTTVIAAVAVGFFLGRLLR